MTPDISDWEKHKMSVMDSLSEAKRDRERFIRYYNELNNKHTELSVRVNMISASSDKRGSAIISFITALAVGLAIKFL